MIVVFNLGSRDAEMLTDSHGFVKEFYSEDDAVEEAEKWIDDTQFRNFKIFNDYE